MVSIMSNTVLANTENVYRFDVGDIKVYLLSEGQNEGNSSILIGATPEQIKQYLPNGTYPSAVNSFLLQTNDQLILIDSGFGRKLFDNLKSLDIKPEQIDTVLLTHMHGDHIGGLLVDDKVAFPKATLYVSQPERAYWTNQEFMKALPENQQGGFKKAQDVLTKYGEKVKTFIPDNIAGPMKPLLKDITAIATFGHTPGHTSYLVQSNDKQLLIWGDLAHAMAIQMPLPDVAVTYDVDPVMAVASRKAALDYVIQNNIPIAGMHIPYPAIGMATKSEPGYLFTPVK